MNRLAEVAAVAALSASTLACSAGMNSHESRPRPSEWSVTVPPAEAKIPTTSTTRVGESYLKLLQSNATLNVIYVPTTETTSPEDATLFEKEIAKADQLIQQEPLFMLQTASHVQEATHGRYNPAAITVSITPTLDTGKDCLDSKDIPQSKMIRKHAEPQTDKNALNVIIVKQLGCDDVMVGGYSNEGLIPILTSRAFKDLGRTSMHELGHSAGLLHANLATCPEPNLPLAKDCKSAEADDPNSIMGYSDDKGSEDFSLPEMHRLGLLDVTEVIKNPDSGEYTLSDIEADRGEAKVLLLDDTYFSWERDLQAPRDAKCTEVTDESSPYPPDMILTTSKKRADGTYRTLRCTAVNKRFATSSLQVRRDLGVKGMGLIMRPDRAPDDGEPELSNGEVINDTVVYESATVKVTYLGQNENNQARVRVENLKKSR